MTEQATVFAKVFGRDRPPTLEEAAEMLGVSVADTNPAFGVILIDPDKSVYIVEVYADALQRAPKQATEQEFFSNPRIGEF